MMTANGTGFSSWLARVLAAEGRFPRDQINVWEKRSSNRGMNLAIYLESSGVLTPEEIQDYYNEYKAESGVVDMMPEEGRMPDDYLPPGSIIGGYKVLSLIGIGGMGVVYRAMQISLQREVALKILKPDRLQDDEYRRRFVNEAILASELSHRHIVRIFEAGQIDNHLYFSMELIDGNNLQQMMDSSGRLDPFTVKRIVIQICTALSHASEKSIVHGDIKPANILMDRSGIAKVADLGLAKRSFEDSKRLFGTFRYVSPEVIIGRKADVRSDLYSLGATIYHLLTGTPPFNGLKKEQILDAHLSGSFPDPARKVADLSPDLSRLVRWMTSLAPEDRPENPQQVVEYLSSENGAASAVSRPVRRISDTPKPAQSGNRLFLLIFLFGLAAIGWFVYAQFFNKSNGSNSASLSPTATMEMSGSATVLQSTTRNTNYAQNARRLYDPKKQNYGRVLEYITGKSEMASGTDVEMLESFKNEIIAERERSTTELVTAYTVKIDNHLKSSDYRAALDAINDINVPILWGYPPEKAVAQNIRDTLLARVYVAFKEALAEVQKLVDDGKLDVAQAALTRLTSKPLGEFESDILHVSLKLDEARAKIAETSRNTAMPLYKAGLQEMLKFIAEGDLDKMKSKVLEMARSTELIPFREDIDLLKTDIVKVTDIITAISSCWDGLETTGETITVAFTSGNPFSGTINKTSKKYWLVFRERGVEGRLALNMSTIVFEDLMKFAVRGGYDPTKNQLSVAILLAAREAWQQVWPAFEAVAISPERTRWIARLSHFSTPQLSDISASKEVEEKAASVYSAMLEAFRNEDMDKVAELAKKLLEEYKDSATTRDHLKSINELLAMAKGNGANVAAEMVRPYDFTSALDRDSFFMRLYGGDIGNLGVDRRGQLSVTDGRDGLLLLKQPVKGKVVIEFEMRIDQGSELRVCLKTDKLGGGIVFNSEEFGPYDSMKVKYKRGGRKVKLAVLDDGILVTVDDKQEEKFGFIGKPNDCIALYFLGQGARISNLQITGVFGIKAANVDSVLKNFDVIYFADIRKKDLPGKEK